ncbi:MAG: DUF1127 domain-containing protein [Devosia sp.]
MLHRVIKAVHTWRAQHETAEELYRLSDHALRDIGLERNEIPEVVRRIDARHND